MVSQTLPSAPPALRLERISLLWPDGHPVASNVVGRLLPDARTDLDLEEVITILSNYEGRRTRFVGQVLGELQPDPHIITFRQNVFQDVFQNAILREGLEKALPSLTTLTLERGHNPRETWSVLLIAQRLGELELYVDVAQLLCKVLEESRPQSEGMRTLWGHLLAVTNSPEFHALQEELPKLRRQLDQAGSVTIGINLSRDLLPESATVLSISEDKIEGKGSVLERLLGMEAGKRGITPLRLADAANIYSVENRLYRDLRKLLEIVATPVGIAVDRYASINARALNTLEPEIAFLLNAVRLCQKLRTAGLPMCLPTVAPLAQRTTKLTGAYNVSLALRLIAKQTPDQPAASQVIRNGITFDAEQARVWILTGPNRGGKTTYTRAVGLAHVLFQSGIFVPAESAQMSPVDGIYTHFPSLEGAQLGMGRLDEEAERLAGIFRSATPYSLILLNEVLAGTNAIEALGLATDAVRGLRLLGVRAIYTTHLHELAAQADTINDTCEGDSRIGSLVAGVESEGYIVAGVHRRTFRIVPGPPRSVSYASEIAEQHGISYQQLAQLLTQRGVLLNGSADSKAT